MSLVSRIQECHRFNLAHFVPLQAQGAIIGHIRKATIEALKRHDRVFLFHENAVEVSPKLDSPRARSKAFEAVAQDLSKKGFLGPWRNESYGVFAPGQKADFSATGVEPLFTIERSAVRFFGLRAYGVHLNGYVGAGRLAKMWVARRSMDLALHPGRLDNMVAGGQPFGLSVEQNLAKEAREEAGIPADLIAAAQPCGSMNYCVETAEGLSPATMFIFDLKLPIEFEPKNEDGEIAAFSLFPLEEAESLVRRTLDFKPNAALVVIDFLLRQGALSEPEEMLPRIRQALGRQP